MPDSSSRDLSSLVLNHRLQLSLHVLQACGWKVISGPFKGLKFPPPVGGWSNVDLGGMALGIYEKEVLDVISGLSEPVELFINLGAADGYYAVGMLSAGLAKHAVCFESDINAHKNILALAQLNNVSERVSLRGTAADNFLADVHCDQNSKNLLLSDIEGGEFQIFHSEALFDQLRNFTILIEVHSPYPECLQKASRIITASQKTHSYKWLTTTSRDLSNFSILDSLDDTNRWLLCSEGRPYRMSWLYLQPLV